MSSWAKCTRRVRAREPRRKKGRRENREDEDIVEILRKLLSGAQTGGGSEYYDISTRIALGELDTPTSPPASNIIISARDGTTAASAARRGGNDRRRRHEHEVLLPVFSTAALLSARATAHYTAWVPAFCCFTAYTCSVSFLTATPHRFPLLLLLVYSTVQSSSQSLLRSL